MEIIITKIVSFFTAIITLLGVVFNTSAPTEGVYPDKNQTVKVQFDEGEFVMNQHDIVVAPYGSDDNDGSLSSPLRTPYAAKEKAKSLKGVDGQITVWFREGTYFLDKTLEFNSQDKGDVLYRSYPNENVVFSGAKEITDWYQTEINGIKVFASDVEINSDSDYFRTLFKNGKSLSRSVYPKQGVFNVASSDISDAFSPEIDYFKAYAAFYAETENVLDFANPEDIDVRIMHYWCDDLLPVLSVDAESGRIETTKPAAMDISAGDNFVFENVREALSLPEEWYLDREEDRLYYVPTEGETAEDFVLRAGSLKKLIDINGVSGISFRGISFEETDWEHVNGSLYPEKITSDHPLYKNIRYITNHPQAAFDIPGAININNASSINFTDCDFADIGFTAIKYGSKVTDSAVTTCHFKNIGANAVYIRGDYAIPATTCNITVKDCHIENYGRISNNAIGVFLVHASDCEISNNEIHDGWYTGISVGWIWGYTENPTNGIKIQNNLIYNIGNGWLSDMGGIYTLGIQPDSVISGNVIYNVGCYDGDNGYGGWGIYLDEGSSGILVENNLVYDCSSQGFHQHYGKDNMIKNNIFAMNKDGQFRITRNEEHNSLFLYNNIFVSDDSLMYARTTQTDWFVDDSNLYWDYKNGGNVFSGESMKMFERENIVLMTVKGYYNNAVFKDPLFKDVENRDFTVALNSPALESGFVPFDYNAGTLTLID